MNFCILKGKVIEDIEFNFIYNSKKISIAKTKIRLDNESVITIKGYNEMADWIYRNLNYKNNIMVYGKIDTRQEIEVIWIMLV